MFAPRNSVPLGNIPWGYATYYRPPSRAPEPDLTVTLGDEQAAELPVLTDSATSQTLQLPQGKSRLYQKAGNTFKTWSADVEPTGACAVEGITIGLPLLGYLGDYDGDAQFSFENASSVEAGQLWNVGPAGGRNNYLDPTCAYT